MVAFLSLCALVFSVSLPIWALQDLLIRERHFALRSYWEDALKLNTRRHGRMFILKSTTEGKYAASKTRHRP